MTLDCSLPLSKLLVDGGMTNNDLLMQTQADLCGKPVGKHLFYFVLLNESQIEVL